MPTFEIQHKRSVDCHHRQTSSASGTKSYFLAESGEDTKETFADEFRYWSWNCLVNGVFTTSRTVGYTQFMIFMILQVIIAGSLCGRLFGNDPYNMNCSKILPLERETAPLGLLVGDNSNDTAVTPSGSSINPTSFVVMMNCLNSAYSDVSPIVMWALSTSSVIVPSLILLPWTPTKDDQESVECKTVQLRWPCLTVYVAYLMRAYIRFLLQFSFVISVPLLYGWRFPSFLVCYDGMIRCDLLRSAHEKTCFIWLLVVINLISCFLTIMEIADIYRNKHVYDTNQAQRSFRSKFRTICRPDTDPTIRFQQRNEKTCYASKGSEGKSEKSRESNIESFVHTLDQGSRPYNKSFKSNIEGEVYKAEITMGYPDNCTKASKKHQNSNEKPKFSEKGLTIYDMPKTASVNAQNET